MPVATATAGSPAEPKSSQERKTRMLICKVEPASVRPIFPVPLNRPVAEKFLEFVKDRLPEQG